LASTPHFKRRKGDSGRQDNEEISATLNQRLADELTSINQYMVHAEMCGNWGYEELDGAL
jgi:bacterioferritin (cytochrome b1)